MEVKCVLQVIILYAQLILFLYKCAPIKYYKVPNLLDFYVIVVLNELVMLAKNDL